MAIGNLERQIVLPSDAKADKVNATFNSGVLTVEVAREPKPKPQRIQVRAEGQKQMAGAA
jgi:HSP20 family molecular chaperone IbpA